VFFEANNMYLSALYSPSSNAFCYTAAGGCACLWPNKAGMDNAGPMSTLPSVASTLANNTCSYMHALAHVRAHMRAHINMFAHATFLLTGCTQVVDYTARDEIAAMDLDGASDLLSCHLFSSDMPIDNKPPLLIGWDYDRPKDELSVFLRADPQPKYLKSTEDQRICSGFSEQGTLDVLYFLNASKNVCRKQG
jgi:hypothetical protein